ncbi:MAG: hypothetical protein ACTHOK_19155, partial [Nocardioidaceae bacterium]
MSAAEELLREYDDCLHVVSPPPPPPDPGSLLAAHLPAAGLALGAVAAVECAANRLREVCALTARPVRLDAARVAASVAGDRMLRVRGEAVDGFAPLSGFFATEDGWVRTHGNYPHHRQRLLSLLGLPEDGDRERVRAALAATKAQEVED